uniref:Uncharacterized protein n=1 Tax=Athene cunicularia TaxID=194338 RepID=A0A663MUY5_ATHCN
MARYGNEQRVQPNSPDYRFFFKNADGKYISTFHDIPLSAGSKEDKEIPAKRKANFNMWQISFLTRVIYGITVLFHRPGKIKAI